MWDKLQGFLILQGSILDLDLGSEKLDGIFVGNRSLAKISTNDVCRKLIDKHKYMEERVIKVWDFHKHIT